MGPLELELHTSVGYQERNLDCQQEQQVFLATEGLLQPFLIFTFYLIEGPIKLPRCYEYQAGLQFVVLLP